MDSIHGHEVLNMMIESGEQYTHAPVWKQQLKRVLVNRHVFTPARQKG